MTHDTTTFDFESVCGDLHWIYRGGTLVARSRAAPSRLFGEWIDVDLDQVSTILAATAEVWTRAILNALERGPWALVLICPVYQATGVSSMILRKTEDGGGYTRMAVFLPGDPLASFVFAEEVMQRIQQELGVPTDIVPMSEAVRLL